MLYVNVNNAFASRIRPPIANSDHNVVYLIPRNKSKFKSSKPVVREIRDWSFEAKEKLKACFDLTDLSLFYNPCSLDETAMVTNDYINLCVQSVIPSKRLFPV
jgi:histone deacetylase complex regulatory component SIN3